MLRTALGLYMDGRDVALPLPTHEEVLVCNETTTTEEVGNFLLRPLGASFINQTIPYFQYPGHLAVAACNW